MNKKAIKKFLKNNVWPILLAGIAAIVTALQLGDALTLDTLQRAFLIGSLTAFLAKFNPRSGGDEPWMTPPKE